MNNHMSGIVKVLYIQSYNNYQMMIQMCYDQDRDINKHSMIFLTDFMRIDDEDYMW